MNGSTLSIIGLALDIFGVICLFWVAPEKHLHPQAMLAFKLNDDDRKKWEDGDRRRKRFAGVALGIIVIGFALQLIGELLS